MAEIKDKVVTVESLSALHEHNKKMYVAKTDIVSVEHGGTGAKTSEDALINLGLVATANEINYIVGTTSNVQDQLDNKQATITGGATTIISNNLPTNKVLVSDSLGKVAHSNITLTELGCLSDVQSNIQTQLDNKADSNHAHDYLSPSGGKLTGALTVNGLFLTSKIDYDDDFPEDYIHSENTRGKIFFKKVSG